MGITLFIILIVTLLPLEENEVLSYFGTPHFSSWISLFTVFFLTAIGLLAGFFPARRAARIRPAEALRYE